MHRSFRERTAARSTTCARRGRGLSALTSVVVIAAMVPVALGALAGVAAAATSFCNPSSITINDRVSAQPPNGATPYPSNVTVSGMSGTTSDVTLSLNGINEGRTDDLDILLEAPGGANLLALSDSGGLNAVSNYNLTLDDAAATTLPDAAAWPSSPDTSKPVDYDTTADEAFPAPAPPPSSATTLSTFDGGNPNGTWHLWIVDDSLGGGAGSIAGGWCLNISTTAAATTTTAVSSGQNPSFTGDSVTFTATVSSTSTVNEGTVDFKVDGTTVASGVSVVSGTAAFTTGGLAEGSHVVQASYNGTANFAPSNGSLTQVVDNHTTVNGNEFCNNGNMAINSAAQANEPATPYPSRVFVSSLPGTVTDVNLTLKGVNHASPDDIDAMLVGPTGANLIVLSDAGGSTAVSNFTVTFDDAAAAPLPDTGGWGTSPAAAQPTNYAPADSFPTPAPSPSGATTLGTFDTTDPNGTWELFVIDDSLGTGGSIANGWCLDFTTGGTPDLGVGLSHSPEPVEINTLLTDSLTLSNTGTGAATTVALSDPLPASFAFVSLNLTSGTAADSCSTPAVGSSGAVSCSWASFASSATATYDLVVRPKQTGSFDNTASVTQDPGDSNPSNDSHTDDVTVATNGRGCTIAGTSGPDTLDGTSGPDVICGLAGDDHIDGMGGDDTIYGLAGDDTLTDTSGTDRLLGGAGDDSMTTLDGSGGDVVNGGRGHNTCSVDPGDSAKKC
ncbi:MAG TPA: Ig-like domain repeat protein [Actinomycetota bacterium]